MSSRPLLVAGQMQPSNVSVFLSVTDLYFHVLARVEQYALNTAIFTPGTTGVNETVTPANFALYLFGMCFSHISKHGGLAGSNKNDVCPSPEKYAIPTGFAKYLEHISPYQSGESMIKTVADLSATLQTTTSFFGTGISDHYWGANLALYPAPSNRFGLVAPTFGTAIDELVVLSTGLLVTLRDLWSSAAAIISEAIVGAGLSCTLYENVPDRAPNASAYATC